MANTTDKKAPKGPLANRLAQLRQRLPALSKPNDYSWQVFSSPLMNAPLGIYVLQDGKLHFANYQFRDFTGYTEEELLETDSLGHVFSADREKVREHAVKTAKGDLSSPYEYRVTTKSGEIRWVMEYAASIPYQGKPASVGYCMDITRFKEAEQQLTKSQQQLFQAQKMESLGTLVAGVAHEINNSLNLITFNVPLLQKIWHDFHPILQEQASKEPDRKFGGLSYKILSENMEKLVSDIGTTARRLTKIVKHLKDFTRRSDIDEKELIKINDAVENALHLAQGAIKKSGVAVTCDLGNDLPAMEANLHVVEQIILNLILNAMQAIDHHQGKVKVVTGFQEDKGQILVSVSDNGKGIAPNIVDKIFDPFVTDRQAEGGTGLGLSVTYNLVKSHEGDITFETQETKGTTFTLSFPTRLRERVFKILVAEDEKPVREMLATALTMDRPYLVEQAENGIEACIKLGVSRPDLLILDVFMPEMNGVEVCRNIRTEPGLSDMKVIIVTGFPGDAKVKQIAAMGFSNIYPKPFNLHDFLRSVDTILKEPRV